MPRLRHSCFLTAHHGSSMTAHHHSNPTTALTRTNSNSQALLASPNRFTTLPSLSPASEPSPSSNPFSNLDFSNLTPETMQHFLNAAGNTDSNFSTLFNNNNNNNGHGNVSIQHPTSAPPQFDNHALSLPPSNYNAGALIPSPSASFHPTTTSNPLDYLNASSSTASSSCSALTQPTAIPSYSQQPHSTAPALSPSLVSNINEHDAILRSVINEKQDIDRRTTELEDQITRLMKNLPEETRDQVMEMDGPLGTASGLGTAVEEKGGFDWGSATGENGELDLDKLLEQFSTYSFSLFHDLSRPGVLIVSAS